MKSNLENVKKAISDKDKSALQSSAADLHKHWLEFENNVRDLYPLQYTDVENMKHLFSMNQKMITRILIR